MESNDAAPSIEALLAHGEWVRAVARRLVADESTADDVVQESFLSALRSPPRHASHPRGWLARAIANRARETGRAESRRRVREERAARPEAQSSMDELARRAATQRDVVGHVLALEEPFRSVVLLRFFEDDSPPEIAQRLGVPLKTVHSRLQRAFKKLRTRLDADYGGREAWCVAFTPLAKLAPPGTTTAGTGLATTTGIATTSAGVWIMSTNAKLALATALILGGSWGLYNAGLLDGEVVPIAPLEHDVAAKSDEPGKAEPERPKGSRPEDPQREALLAAVPVSDEAHEESAPPPDALSVRGHVLDPKGNPVVDVQVHTQGATQHGSARTSGDGSFEVHYVPTDSLGTFTPDGTVFLSASSDGWGTMRESSVTSNNRDADHVIVASRTLTAEGWVADAQGVPIRGAKVMLSPQGRSFYGFSYVLDRTRPVELAGKTDDNGHFLIEGFPKASGLSVSIDAAGFRGQALAVDEIEWPLHVVLSRPEEEGAPTIAGIVLDPYGLGVEGALVQLATNETITDGSGRFRLPLVDETVAEQTPLCASAEGHLAALLPEYGKTLKGELPFPAQVELTLGQKPLSIRGKLVDADGLPWPKWVLSIVDVTEISQYRMPMISAEGQSGMSMGTVRSAEDGRFQIDGLYDRSYTLRAYDAETLRVVERQVRAGDMDIRLLVERREPLLFEARLLDSSAAPLEGVRVSLNLRTALNKNGFTSVSGRTVDSGPDGRFALEYSPNEALFLRFSGENIIHMDKSLPSEAQEEPLDIRVARRCHFRVEMPDGWSAGTKAQLLDEKGEGLLVYEFQAGGWTTYSEIRLKEGSSVPLSASDAARTLIFFEGGRENELHRIPIQLTGEGVQVLHP